MGQLVSGSRIKFKVALVEVDNDNNNEVMFSRSNIKFERTTMRSRCLRTTMTRRRQLALAALISAVGLLILLLSCCSPLLASGQQQKSKIKSNHGAPAQQLGEKHDRADVR